MARSAAAFSPCHLFWKIARPAKFGHRTREHARGQSLRSRGQCTRHGEGGKACYPEQRKQKRLSTCNGPPLYGYLYITERTISFVPTKSSYIFSKINPLNTDTGHFSVFLGTKSHKTSTSMYGHLLSMHCLFSLSHSCVNC